ncbi:uncharacterized protein EV420DRAFT_1480647 [Desarmillaria tabescens]|uniref:Heterokaryon incompatibility domain-containing protein n=1 Tax=Armillaria tabescens TaxID=1929756 RepID=A0AA39KCZ4_ARMTA|nr:uncharacterized protein EV420DRAFT_1480647 [Desarmillaria tabescens]KAK0457586.1 hypothetical protein EV420DRAFT_1480647 [Desarmillaria tabescens]
MSNSLRGLSRMIQNEKDAWVTRYRTTLFLLTTTTTQQKPVGTTAPSHQAMPNDEQWSRPIPRDYLLSRMWGERKSYDPDNTVRQKYESLPEVTLSAYDEIGREESSIPVLKQRAYTGRILPSVIADTPCADLGVDGMLGKFDGPSRTPDSPLYKACEDFVTKSCDFGTAYAHLRPRLYDIISIGQVSDDMKAREDDEKMRQNMCINKQITDAPPRRVWDLVANRVMPWWIKRKFPWAISHTWVDDNDLKGEMTPINGYEWPVPMPKDADLNLIRIEMLRLGAEYAWLDILCLRQQGQGEDPRGNPSQEEWDRREALRKEEWKVDIPTIGWIYHKSNQVVCYFSGLGLPLSFKPGDFESDRCWFNRAWTLQEITKNSVVAGKTRDDNRVDERFMTEDMRKVFDEKLASLKEIRREDSILDVLLQMQKRKSTKLVDKVAGLAYLFYSQYIPIYDADQSEEDAWTELVNITQWRFRGELFFCYPGPGNGNKIWCPSWRQVMMENLSGLILPLHLDIYGRDSVYLGRKKEDGDYYDGPYIDSCRVRGLSDESTPETPRHGELDVTDRSGENYTFEIVANHTFPIPDGLYTLIGTSSYPYFRVAVIGKIEGPEKKFRKVSVINMGDEETAKINRLHVKTYNNMTCLL